MGSVLCDTKSKAFDHSKQAPLQIGVPQPEPPVQDKEELKKAKKSKKKKRNPKKEPEVMVEPEEP